MAHHIAHIKIKEPRKLECKETVLSLQQWKMQYKQYMKQDDQYKTFLGSNVVWDPNLPNYGFIAETRGLERTANDIMDDCKDFLHILATFLPHGYLTEKIVKTATSFEKAFEIIQEHYGLLPTQESFLDLESFNKQTGESYRQFYERLLAHARQHLHSTPGIAVDGAIVPEGGDTITVSHANLIALTWLRKVHPELLNIVRTEYSLELRDNRPLAGLVPRIAVNIDNLLAKYDKINCVNNMQCTGNDNFDQAAVNRTQTKKNNAKKDFKDLFCPGCYGFSKNSKTSIHYKHLPSQCPRQALVKLLQMDDLTGHMDQLEVDTDEGKYSSKNSSHASNLEQVQTNLNEFPYQESYAVNMCQEEPSMEAIISNIKTKINGFRKENSPSFICQINHQTAVCLVDEGSVINCCSYKFAKKANIPLENVHCSAIGANKTPMTVMGMTKYDIYAHILGTNSPCSIKIAKMIIIKDLGVDVLLGQPAKVDNCIVTIPHKSSIEFKSIDGVDHKVTYPLRNIMDMKLHDVMKVGASTTIFPGEKFSYKLPNQFIMQKKVVVTGRPSNSSWIGCEILDTENGLVHIENNTLSPVHLKKHQHIADVHNVQRVNTSVISKVTDNDDDLEHLQPFSNWNYDDNYVADIKIDPDGVMTELWRNKFLELCTEFKDIINYRPGRYNGFYGNVDNSIDFSSIPPPTSRVYMPKYSDKMNQILAQKMDQLEEWQVLVTPEKVGVVPSFVCPSLLVPKDGTEDWRLITNFTPLNKFIRKPPTSAPTIEETKRQLSKFKFIATLDLANFYYQHGMRTKDMQYLATNHPYKGLRVYQCEPQGMRGASEHSYERLSRIYGELCQNGKMARQADGLFVGGNTIQELLDNLREVFERTRNCGFTLKPSKIVINPQKIVIFGWVRNKGGWEPTEHTVTPLLKAEPPKTVRQLRSFLGAVKQLSACIENYAVILSPLEKVAAGKGSSELITWTDVLMNQFEAAKQSLRTIKTYFSPSPDDILHTFSDWSQLNGAVGGRLEIHRYAENGGITKLHGGFFSARVSQWQSRWLPCEGEALATKLVLQHFKPLLLNSDKTIIHHTDSLPTVQAWQKSKTGAFSNSARISAFLTELSTLDVELVHNPGKNMEYSDYASRHAFECLEKSCQVCSYLKNLVFTADNIIGNISVQDIEKGNIAMPFTQQAAWKQAQTQDKTLQTLLDLIKSGQVPEKKKTCNDYTVLKLLYNLYCKGLLKISSQGLITVTQTQESGQQVQTIVVPTSLYPGLVHSIHLKTMHCSKMQLQRLMSRYFYAVGHHRMIGEVIDNCHTCLSLKQLPKELFPETTGDIIGFGSHFACDVMVRNSQKILLIREKLTQFAHGVILNRETSEDILSAIVMLIADKIPDYGTIIRTDNASVFQKIHSLSADLESWLNKFHIKIEMGETFNKNRNPIAENLVKECHKEINKAGYSESQLNEFQLALVLKNINSRIRDRNLSSKEMCFMRDLATNKNINHKDSVLKAQQSENRTQSHNKVPPVTVQYDMGETVMIKDSMSKLKPREKFVIVDPDVSQTHVKIQKQDKKFMARQYDVPKHQLLRVPRQAAVKAKKKISESAKLCHLYVKENEVPIHAFNDADSTDDEDTVYYNCKENRNGQVDIDATTNSTSSTSPNSLEFQSDRLHDSWMNSEDLEMTTPHHHHLT